MVRLKQQTSVKWNIWEERFIAPGLSNALVVPQAAEYLHAVASMGASIQAMETVGMLAREDGILPPDFLSTFVPRCIASCDPAQVFDFNRYDKSLCMLIRAYKTLAACSLRKRI